MEKSQGPSQEQANDVHIQDFARISRDVFTGSGTLIKREYKISLQPAPKTHLSPKPRVSKVQAHGSVIAGEARLQLGVFNYSL